MEQAKIEQLAFLYLCSEHDKRLLLKKEKMPLADFDRLTYGTVDLHWGDLRLCRRRSADRSQ